MRTFDSKNPPKTILRKRRPTNPKATTVETSAETIVPKPHTKPDPLPIPPTLKETDAWILDARKADLIEVAQRLGYTVTNPKDRSRRIVPCPRCGREKGAWIVNHQRWKKPVWGCSCDALWWGNLDLVAATLWRDRSGNLNEDGKAEVRAWYARSGWCSDAP